MKSIKRISATNRLLGTTLTCNGVLLFHAQKTGEIHVKVDTSKRSVCRKTRVSGTFYTGEALKVEGK